MGALGTLRPLPDPKNLFCREPDRLDSLLPAGRRRALRPPPSLGRAPARTETAKPTAQRIYPRALPLGLSIRPRRRRAAPQYRRQSFNVGLRLSPSGIRLARVIASHR